MNNNTDITYSFNLDNYINSLESSLPFNDYKILVNNKDYNTLSLEHNRLINEVNTMINSDMFSTESFKENISKFISWFKDMINRLITMISTFIKRIIAKIYELTLRSKNGLYKQFKSAAFTSVNLSIKDRKLNPKMMEDMDIFLQKLADAEEAFFDQNDDNKSFAVGTAILGDILDKLKEKDGIKNFIDSIFYIEKNKVNTTIREYFGCNVGQTPKQIIILSDQYKDRLVKVKKDTELFLKKLKSVKNDLMTTLAKTTNADAADVENFKKIIKNITYFHNMNYTFFIKAVQVRAKVAKYILKGSIGHLFDALNGEPGKDPEFKPFREMGKYYQKDTEFERFRERDHVRDIIQESDYQSKRTHRLSELGTIKDFEEPPIRLNSNLQAYNGFCFHFDVTYHLDNTPEERARLTKKAEECIRDLKAIAKGETETPFPLLRKWMFDLFKIQLPEKATYILQDLSRINFRLICLVSLFNYQFNDKDDTFYFTGYTPNRTEILPFIRGQSYKHLFYTEKRMYGGINRIIQKNGLTDKSFKNLRLQLKQFLTMENRDLVCYKVEIPNGSTILADPEYFHKLEPEANVPSCFFITDSPIKAIDITSIILNDENLVNL